jgi:hypothetical protein
MLESEESSRFKTCRFGFESSTTISVIVPTLALIVPVFPVVAQGVTVIELVPPLPAAKLGSAVMVRAIIAVVVSVPEVPVMVTVIEVEGNGARSACGEGEHLGSGGRASGK